MDLDSLRALVFGFRSFGIWISCGKKTAAQASEIFEDAQPFAIFQCIGVMCLEYCNMLIYGVGILNFGEMQ